ncbi:hypothetical protein QSH39_014540 [Xanthomonas arboricola pv. corylina]|uniref:hypothetical protein n=1 Tax=Xanthomonas arboricola TaxID=56448 RepID=UPI0011B0C670|nr:hypothetical protein [Xanthomonas arboricola]MDN0202753.1 hypothetical protein [Xanthomonas arboricola pv. corylina]MDN0206289.1 hypothetical protein [Xanthomonas arboricola pv. corylina]MDN0210734.1 hypothetical protein [Xanthomonas arboricola pv. corylina]MDN0215306.1 hypothetical protein [Xanthomonas arboricola pv. corylina]QUI79502.1 hypothetical protein ICA18_14655 [Xanthomonas arboricola pv. corylina]
MSVTDHVLADVTPHAMPPRARVIIAGQNAGQGAPVSSTQGVDETCTSMWITVRSLCAATAADGLVKK